jgi:acetyl-CoA carboxylase carboxyl transferase subunit alpha
MRHFLDFEKPIAELEGKIEELRRMSEPDGINIADEVARLTVVADKQLRATYARLTPWSHATPTDPRHRITSTS